MGDLDNALSWPYKQAVIFDTRIEYRTCFEHVFLPVCINATGLAYRTCFDSASEKFGCEQKRIARFPVRYKTVVNKAT
jgi:hypothetical protein